MSQKLRTLLAQLVSLEKNQDDPNISPEQWQQQGNDLLAAAGTLKLEEMNEFYESFKSFQERENDKNLTIWVKEQFAANSAVFVSDDDKTETWKVGLIEIIVPKLQKRMSLKLYAAVVQKQESEKTGQCTCGASGVSLHGKYFLPHTETCHANDLNIKTSLQEFYK